MNFLLLNLIIALSLIALSTFGVAIFLLLRHWENKTSRIFAFNSLSITLWSLFQILANISNSPEDSLFWSRLMISAVFFIPVLFLHFIISFLNLKKRKWILWFGYAQGIFFALMSFTPYMLANATHKQFLKYWANPGGAMLYVANAIFFILVVYALYELFKAYLKSSGTKRDQLTLLFWPALLSYIGSGANFFLIYDIYIPILNPFGTYLTPIYVFTVTYAILKYQFMDIKIVIKKTLIYSIGMAFISGSIVGISFLSNWFSENVPELKSWIVSVMAGAAAFVIGNIFWRKSKEVDKLKYEFATIAAHKLRTPLTKIKWGLDALDDKSLPEKEKKKIKSVIKKSNNRLIDLTDQLLSILKAESGQYNFKLEPLNLEEIAKEIIEGFQVQIKEKKIKLLINIEKNLPKVSIEKIRISSVIYTLLENAINYTKDEIKITIDIFKNNVIFHIEDNGIGIPKEEQAFIFSKFYRTHEAYLSETEGAGINLFLAKNIIEKHNGKIGARSGGKGKGSIFWFSLDIA